MPRSRLFGLALVLLPGLLGACAPQVSGPLRQDVYVWQRSRGQPVKEAVLTQEAAFESIVFLGAEMSWRGGQPKVARPDVSYATLRRGKPVGIALRIGPFSGPFSRSDGNAQELARLAGTLLAECASNSVPVTELQIDFDCASSKLEGYVAWLQAIRAKTGTIPLIVTVLPSWLRERAFTQLAAAVDGFVLQVHSLERPKSPESAFVLCDPNSAQKWARQASSFGRPFRVALPTYGYLVAFDRERKFIGLSADGPELTWPPGALLRETRADPQAIAGLVRYWTATRPPNMTGVIWYRLPVRGERLNWSWPTLAAVMKGRTPVSNWRVELSHPAKGLVEVLWSNDGEMDVNAPPGIAVEWSGARCVAGDGLGGFELETKHDLTAWFSSRAARELKPGETRKIGWLRLDPPETEARVRSF